MQLRVKAIELASLRRIMGLAPLSGPLIRPINRQLRLPILACSVSELLLATRRIVSIAGADQRCSGLDAAVWPTRRWSIIYANRARWLTAICTHGSGRQLRCCRGGSAPTTAYQFFTILFDVVRAGGKIAALSRQTSVLRVFSLFPSFSIVRLPNESPPTNRRSSVQTRAVSERFDSRNHGRSDHGTKINVLKILSRFCNWGIRKPNGHRKKTGLIVNRHSFDNGQRSWSVESWSEHRFESTS